MTFGYGRINASTADVLLVIVPAGDHRCAGDESLVRERLVSPLEIGQNAGVVHRTISCVVRGIGQLVIVQDRIYVRRTFSMKDQGSFLPFRSPY